MYIGCVFSVSVPSLFFKVKAHWRNIVAWNSYTYVRFHREKKITLLLKMIIKYELIKTNNSITTIVSAWMLKFQQFCNESILVALGDWLSKGTYVFQLRRWILKPSKVTKDIVKIVLIVMHCHQNSSFNMFAMFSLSLIIHCKTIWITVHFNSIHSLFCDERSFTMLATLCWV